VNLTQPGSPVQEVSLRSAAFLAVRLDFKGAVARHGNSQATFARKLGDFRVARSSMSAIGDQDERTTLERELQILHQEHRDLDAAIAALEGVESRDQLQIQRLKKRKLVLKDRIVLISGKLRPDIIA
jgi:hypothetical protein